jgi:hypothetical protein
VLLTLACVACAVPRRFWWEFITIIRRTVLIGIAVIFTSREDRYSVHGGSPLSCSSSSVSLRFVVFVVIDAAIFNLIFLALHMRMRPFLMKARLCCLLLRGSSALMMFRIACRLRTFWRRCRCSC